MTKERQPDYRVVLRPLPGWTTPAIVRLRRALKMLLRGFGLRCIEVCEIPPIGEVLTEPGIGAEGEP